MSRSPKSRSGGPSDPYSAHSVLTTLAVATGFVAALVAATVAVSYPVASVALVLTAATVVAVRSLYRRLLVRRREGRARRVCVPTTDVCLEA